ncbi:hypothetical protein IE53DRAFT_211630 [Violaceomyces palustris]|uniref:Uncharacterized protein n=1 Tax=Violaceomyces palustris TaxID=1673888 RepID=A0ACD0NQQ3_9BASI|nr:hypothetical protein IE53DRAFT_211630 [Violaceomyces palustris]
MYASVCVSGGEIPLALGGGWLCRRRRNRSLVLLVHHQRGAILLVALLLLLVDAHPFRVPSTPLPPSPSYCTRHFPAFFSFRPGFLLAAIHRLEPFGSRVATRSDRHRLALAW